MNVRKNYPLVFLFFLILCLLVFLLFKIPLFSNISSFFRGILISISSPFQFVVGTNQKIFKLTQEKIVLSQKLVDQTKLVEDNSALRDQFATVYPKSSDLIPAKVAGAPSFIPGITEPEYLVVDKGSKDGVKKGQAVVYKDNLLGIIESVGLNYSKVALSVSQTFSETATTLDSNSVGIAKGQGAGEVVLENILLSQNLKKDELVLTYGGKNIDGQGVAPNLIIGKITSVNKNPSSLFQSAKITPLLNFTQIKQVFIVK